MKIKEEYYRAFKKNDGELNEIDLGEKIGIDEDETMKIIAELLAEYKIEYVQHKACHYSLMSNKKIKQ